MPGTVSKALLKRIAVIDREIGQNRYPNKERLASRLGVSAKTIQRDLEFMKFEYDAPIGFDKQRLGFYYTEADFRMNPLQIEANDFLAVAVTEKILNHYKNTPYVKYFKTFFQKLESMFGDKLSVDIRDIDKIMSFDMSPVRNVASETMSVVNEALEKNRRVKVKYYTGSRASESERKLDIYHLKNYNGDWYIIAYCHTTSKVKVFALSRVREISLTNQTFTVPGDFSIEDYFNDSFGIFKNSHSYIVKLKITGYMVRYITERKWHKSEKLTKLSDGSITLEYKVNDLTEIKFWILSMGSSCEVLSPKELRTEIHSELQYASRLYNP